MNQYKFVRYAVCNALLLAMTGCLSNSEHQQSMLTDRGDVQSGSYLTVVMPKAGETFSGNTPIAGFCHPEATIKITGDALAEPKTVACSADGRFVVQLASTSTQGQRTVVVQSVLAGGAHQENQSISVIIDTEAPATSIVSPAQDEMVGQGSMVSGLCESPYDVHIQSEALVSPMVYKCMDGSYSGPLVFQNGHTESVLRVIQTDSAGNRISLSRSLLLDLNAPAESTLSIDTPTTGSFFSSSIVLSGICNEKARVQVSVPKASYSGELECTNGSYSADLNSILTVDGSHTLIVSQMLGEVQDAKAVTVVRDTVKPALKIVNPKAGEKYSGSLIVSGQCESGTNVQLRSGFIAGAVSVPCSNSQFSSLVNLSGITGAHTLNLSQADRAGNISQGSQSFEVIDGMNQQPAADGLALYTNNCAGCHGAVANSNKKGRSASDIQVAIQYVGSMRSLSVLSATQLEAIASVLNPQLPPVSGGDTEPTPEGGLINSPYMCKSGDGGASKTRKLSVREYQQTLIDLMNGAVTVTDISRELGSLPDDRKRHGFDTEGSSVSGLVVEGHLNVAARIGDLLRGNTSRLQSIGPSCVQLANVSDSCALDFFDKFGQRALRRPLLTDEKQRYFELYQMLKGDVSDKVALTYVVEAFLQSPQFLYKVEDQGFEDPSVEGLKLTNYEVANRISYLIAGTMPDATLFAAAANGSLMDETVRENQVQRLMASTQAKTQVRNYYEQWFGLNRLKSMPNVPPGVTGVSSVELSQMAKQEIYDFMDLMIWTQEKPFASILSDPTAVIKDPAMAQLYGLSGLPSRALAGEVASDDRTFEAESFSMKTNVGGVEQGGFSIWSEDESIAENFTTESGEFEVEISARRHVNGQVPDQAAIMNVYVDGQPAQSFNVRSDTLLTYTFTKNLTAGQHMIQIVFKGDYYSDNPAGDINLLIDKMRIHGGASFAPQELSLAASGRAGLLTRAAFLVSGEKHSNPIVRGVEILKDVQCMELAPPDASDPALAEAFTAIPYNPMKTNRERVSMKTSPVQCQVCHNQINPIGFAFENYGAFGEFQTTEVNDTVDGSQSYELPVDAQVTARIDGMNQSVMNAVELSQLLSESTKVRMCAAEKLFTFSQGRKPASGDDCSLEHIYKRLVSNKLSFKDYYRSVVSDPNFLVHRMQ